MENIIVVNRVPDYQLPRSCKVQIEVIFDSYVMEDVIETVIEGIKESKENPGYSPSRMEELLKKAKAIILGPYLEIWDFKESPESLNETDGDFIAVYGKGLSKTDALGYIMEFRDYLEEAWESRGADDDYYDYLPSITDVFRQITKAWGFQKEWKDFKSWLWEQEDWDNPENEISLYRNRMEIIK